MYLKRDILDEFWPDFGQGQIRAKWGKIRQFCLILAGDYPGQKWSFLGIFDQVGIWLDLCGHFDRIWPFWPKWSILVIFTIWSKWSFLVRFGQNWPDLRLIGSLWSFGANLAKCRFWSFLTRPVFGQFGVFLPKFSLVGGGWFCHPRRRPWRAPAGYEDKGPSRRWVIWLSPAQNRLRRFCGPLVRAKARTNGRRKPGLRKWGLSLNWRRFWHLVNFDQF